MGPDGVKQRHSPTKKQIQTPTKAQNDYSCKVQIDTDTLIRLTWLPVRNRPTIRSTNSGSYDTNNPESLTKYTHTTKFRSNAQPPGTATLWILIIRSACIVTLQSACSGQVAVFVAHIAKNRSVHPNCLVDRYQACFTLVAIVSAQVTSAPSNFWCC